MIRFASRMAAPALALCAALCAGSVAPAAAKDQGISSSRGSAIVSAAKRVSPAVVTVNVIQTRVVRADPFGGLMRDEFWERFSPGPQYRERVPSMGSGVVVDARGLILTNSHVVRDAEQISISLSDGRVVPATLLGASPTYDLAVLKVKDERLPVAPLGDSEDLVVGEWAIAIGSPFGFLLNDTQPTVTAGVISAMHRDIKSEATDTGVYVDMIQTDAAINPGNSGGPLVNGDGEVIGINTFIFTRGGGSLGIGFAVPINLAKRVVDEIAQYGKVRTAWPGMQVQEVTVELAQRLGYKDAGGLVVTRVEANGPAERAGVQVSDRIRKVNGRPVVVMDDVQRGVYGSQVGDTLRLSIERGDKTLDIGVKLVEAPRSNR
jgi:serine protease Do